MKITVRFAHLAEKPDYSKGDIIKKDYHIGNMGSTGQSAGAHLHIDNVLGTMKSCWRLIDAERGNVEPVPRELNRFIVPELFGGSIRVTTPYADYEYQKERGKLHLAYDVSTDKGWPWRIFWPIKEDGLCEAVVLDDVYGWVLFASYIPKE